MDILLDWVKNIAFFLILSGILQQILPEGRYRKYFRFVSGLILVILVASPIGNLFSWEEELVKAADRFSWEQQGVELEQDIRLADENLTEQLEMEYEALIREQVASITDAYGYKVVLCEAELELDVEAEDFGRVISLKVTLTEDASDTNIWIEPVEIGEKEEKDDFDGQSELRRELRKVYSLQEDELVINLMD